MSGYRTGLDVRYASNDRYTRNHHSGQFFGFRQIRMWTSIWQASAVYAGKVPLLRRLSPLASDSAHPSDVSAGSKVAPGHQRLGGSQ